VPNRPALHAGECFDDEQVQAIGSVVAVDDHELPGPLREVAPPFRFRSAAPSVPGPAPMVGEHTGEILLLPAKEVVQNRLFLSLFGKEMAEHSVHRFSVVMRYS
jgi:crotonobetainyl-CoA:carnitine CoA-transferase CaiB-like acyl-CoA transferase